MSNIDSNIDESPQIRKDEIECDDQRVNGFGGSQ